MNRSYQNLCVIPKEIRDFSPLMQHPFFQLSKIENEFIDEGENWSLKISHQSSVLPYTYDHSCILGLWSIIFANKKFITKTDGKFSVVKRDINSAIGRKDSGSDYERIKKSFDRLSGTQFKFSCDFNTLLPVNTEFKLLEDFTSDGDGYHFSIPSWFMELISSKPNYFLKINPAFFEMAPSEQSLYRLALRSLVKDEFSFKISTAIQRINTKMSKPKFIKRIHSVAPKMQRLGFNIATVRNDVVFSKIVEGE